MKKYLLFAVVVFLFLVSLGTAQTGTRSKKGSLLNVLSRRESRLWEAWKNKQAAPFRNALSADTVLVGEQGFANKEEAVQAITSPDCTVQDYALSDFKVTMFSKDMALLNYKAKQNVICGGNAQPANIVASSLWVRRGGKWYAAFHQETPGS